MTLEDPEKKAKPPVLSPHILERFRREQNFGLAVLAGIGGSLGGAAVWAVVTISTGWQIGLMSVVVGIAAGSAVKKAGKGIDLKFGILGGAYGLLGSIIGDMLSAEAHYADKHRTPILEYISRQNISSIMHTYIGWFSLDNVFFYGFAVYAAYHNSFKYRIPKPAGLKTFLSPSVTENDQIAMTSYLERFFASQGSAATQYELGKKYRDGKHAPKDSTEALKWFLMAAEKGNMAAQFEVGWMYESGTGIERDRTEATKWYIKAAEQGYPRARNELGHRYAAGIGVTKDLTEAYFWYSLPPISPGENSTDQSTREELGRLLEPEQVAKIEKRVDEWKKAKTNLKK